MNPEIYGKYEIIDGHTHIFPEKIAENATINIGKFYDLPMNDQGMSRKLIEAGSRIGVSKYLVCSTATVPHQTESINRFIANECAAHPEFYGFGTVHPDSEDIERDIAQIKELGLHGVKLHPDFQLFDADAPKAFRIYEIIEGDLPLLIHCGDHRYEYSAPSKIANICKNFPNLRLQAAHFGGWSRWDDADEYLAGKGFDNMVVDICSSLAFMSPEKAGERIKRFGVDRCFFGTDFPMWDHEKELEMFLKIGLTEEENRMVLAENFKRFYNI